MVSFLSLRCSIINPSGVDTTGTEPTFLKLLRWASPIHWAIEALCLAEYRGMVFRDDRTAWWRPWKAFRDLPKIGGLALVRNGDQVLAALGLADATYEKVMKNLAILSGINLFLSWVGLQITGTTFEQAEMADWTPAPASSRPHLSGHQKTNHQSLSTQNATITMPVVRNL